jgi:pimeloyl-ACP methyl ester carboxylesterase
MFGSRYLSIPMHVIAERAGVRLLVVDRPGMGASTDVPLSQRIAVWVDMLPRLLAHLGIPRVSLVSHSAGTIYLLNTWAHCREIMSPVITFLGNHSTFPPRPKNERKRKQDTEKKSINSSVSCYSSVG